MIRTRDIMSFRHDLGLGYLLRLLANIYGEAPAYYSSVTVRHWGDGTRVSIDTSATTTQTIEYDESATFSRAPIHTSAVYNSTDQLEFGTMDLFVPDPPEDGTCHIKIKGMPRSNPYLSRHYLDFNFYETRDVNVGVEAIDYFNPLIPDTSGPLMKGIDFMPWEWSGGGVNFGDPWDVLSIPIGWLYSPSPIDLSAITDWRDLRGTYTVSVNNSDIDGSWATNSLVHNTSITIT